MRIDPTQPGYGQCLRGEGGEILRALAWAGTVIVWPLMAVALVAGAT